jgi:hypothetical protein
MPISCKVVLAGSLICLFVHLSCAQTQIPATAAPKPTGPPIPVLPPQSLSTVPVGVSADLNSLLAQVSSALPSGVNADGAWGVIDNDFAGNVGLKYKVWRDNPSIQISGNTVTLGLNIYYQFAIAQRVRNGIFVGGYSWHQVASCGYGEPPRQAHVTMAYQLSWNQNYHLNVTGKWTVSYGPCNLTAANFNGVPRVQSLVNPKIADTANKLQAAIEAVDFRQQVQNPLDGTPDSDSDTAASRRPLHNSYRGRGKPSEWQWHSDNRLVYHLRSNRDLRPVPTAPGGASTRSFSAAAGSGHVATDPHARQRCLSDQHAWRSDFP